VRGKSFPKASDDESDAQGSDVQGRELILCYQDLLECSL